MDSSSKIIELLTDLLQQLPSLLAILACMIFAIVRWKKSPRVSMVVLIGLALTAVHLIVSSIAYTWIPDLFINASALSDRATTVRNVYLVMGLITNTSLGVVLLILLTAIFMQRQADRHQP